MGDGVLIGFGKGVCLLVNVLKGRFYAIGTPPIRVGSAMGNKDGLQVMDGFGRQPHIQVSLVLLPVVPVLLGKKELVLSHRFVSCRMTTVSPAEARPYRIAAKITTALKLKTVIPNIKPSQNDRQVTQLNGLCLPSHVLYHQPGRTWYSAMARAARLLTRSGSIISMV